MKRFCALVLCLLLLASDQAKATVVFTDTFTVGVNANLDAYPATPDYAMTIGATTDLVVTATTDNVVAAVATDAWARIIDGTAPTGDQEITATFDSGGSGGLAVRTATDDTENGYVVIFNGTEVNIYRVHAGIGFTEIASCARTYGSTYTGRFRATGSGATVSLTAQVDATAECTFDDTDANRKTSGVPGIFLSGNIGSSFDNVSVDNLAATMLIKSMMLSRRRR